MDFHALDLNLLVLFDGLLRTRSVTLAGEKVGLSQSAASSALQRLRVAFDDPLFVRTPRGMEPTAFALELEQPLRAAMDQLRAVVETGRTFDPATSDRVFKVLMSDIAQMVHLPSIMATVRAQAPGVRLDNHALGLREAKDALTAGELDLAVGFLPDLGADFHRQSLFQETWVCVLSRRHPTITGPVSHDAYFSAGHVSYHPAMAIHSVLDQHLEAQFASQGRVRDVRLTLPYTSGLAATVAECDLLLTVPLGLARAMVRLADVRITALPFALPSIDLSMQWHGRVHRDPGARWLRDTVAQRYRAKEPAGDLLKA